MSSLEFERRKRPGLQLDMTPLIDMVFLLLIFFVLSSQFVSHRGFEVKLPKAAHAGVQKEEKLTVVLRQDGKIFLNGKEVPIEKLKEALAASSQDAKSKSLTLQADEGVPLGAAVKVMDAAKEAKINGLVIAAQVAHDQNRR